MRITEFTSSFGLRYPECGSAHMCISMFFNVTCAHYVKHQFIWLYRQKAASKLQNDRVKKTRTRNRAGRTIPIQGANAELQSNIDVRLFTFVLFGIVYFAFLLGNGHHCRLDVTKVILAIRAHEVSLWHTGTGVQYHGC